MYNIVSNPIPHSGLFATPESLEDLMSYLQNFSGAERTVAMTVAMMTLNLSHKLVETEILSKEIFAS
jgi:hypothetical protein